MPSIVVEGTARLVSDADTRALATRYSSYEPAGRYILFELDVDAATSTVYENGGPVREHWKRQ